MPHCFSQGVRELGYLIVEKFSQGVLISRLFSVSAWTEGTSMVWTNITRFQRQRYWNLEVNQSTLIWQDERDICEALIMSSPSPHAYIHIGMHACIHIYTYIHTSSERSSSPDLLLEDGLQAPRLNKCFLQRGTEAEKSENFLQAGRSKEREKELGT